ncbi:type 1 glutamine amidotransferase domain-containing protein [Microbacterium sediminis]|uniref:Thiamine biosynthesis protein ThiJ n=1 Tax=Microbacterium sediminis TaxID=904291 RepID=A0A1B9NJ04_9MICO|nr:type 1 glutamine amidotransferase domain-containing protein [Microbacterium sediminis]OCG76582.1 thiamine biosynthesis protein ThiJ [Microbacterium sediminis]QBR73814.1 type 1 glutamine amidotransferase domain-containing protein [Microbacterium sediminis]
MSTVLFVVTGARSWTLADGRQHPTGYWAEELLTPYRILTEAGHRVAFATPGGVEPVIDAASLEADPDARAAIEAIEGLARPLPLEEVALGDYDAVFYPGGHGPMEDLAADPTSGALIAAALRDETPLALVCHGVAALLAARDADGALAARGRTVAAFTDEEERQGGLADAASWLLESTLREQGVTVDTAAPWADHVVEDGALVSGQNSQSSASVARALLARLA